MPALIPGAATHGDWMDALTLRCGDKGSLTRFHLTGWMVPIHSTPFTGRIPYVFDLLGYSSSRLDETDMRRA